jgi:hypothetical protein
MSLLDKIQQGIKDLFEPAKPVQPAQPVETEVEELDNSEFGIDFTGRPTNIYGILHRFNKELNRTSALGDEFERLTVDDIGTERFRLKRTDKVEPIREAIRRLLRDIEYSKKS